MPRLPWGTRSGVKPLGQLLGTRVPLGCLRSSCRGAEVGTGRVGGAEWGRSPDLCVHLGWGDKVLSVTGFDPPSLRPHASPVCTGRSGNRPPPHLLSHHLSCPSSSPTPTRFHLHLRRNHLSTHRSRGAWHWPLHRRELPCLVCSALPGDGTAAPHLRPPASTPWHPQRQMKDIRLFLFLFVLLGSLALLSSGLTFL